MGRNSRLRIGSLLAFCFFSLFAQAAVPKAKDFASICDSLALRLKERTSVELEPKVTRVAQQGTKLNLYFNADLSYYPWHSGDVEWFRSELLTLWDSVAKGYSLGKIYSNRYEISELTLPLMGNDGSPTNYKLKTDDPRDSDSGFIHRIGSVSAPLGLDGRYIALWQSHGRYWNADRDSWIWQRAPLHRSVEDMLTQGFVLPFLIPMLERAGAYVMTPRERDLSKEEIIIDNDPTFEGFRDSLTRQFGQYREEGQGWKDASEGFADFKRRYTFEDNPFKAGTSRSTKAAGASAYWSFSVRRRGFKAVYVSYKTLQNSTTRAHYTVKHLGGETEFTVNQKRGSGTWIYLGTFEFAPDSTWSVSLDGQGLTEGEALCADAVKIGGGMGKLERGGKTSGVASSAEGAHYWMQWAGVDKDVTQNWDTDYTNDFASRGPWVAMMREQKNIPIDLSLGFHTDAGLAQKDSTIGTLAIYTLRCDGEREFPDGRDRSVSRLLCAFVQSQVVEDVREDFNPEWSRRGLWDKSYSESRTAGVPAMILELLSHQNLPDMKLALDPAFRFVASRAVYKGILKTLSAFYGCSYAVQPLPPRAFSAILDGSKVMLRWAETPDDKEPTAVPSAYIVYTRRDGGVFDEGTRVEGTSYTTDIEKGHIYSFKVEALNAGGRSFPSEILSIGSPASKPKGKVLIVNDFTKVSGPAVIEGDKYAGFDSRTDTGVGYISDITYVGENYEFDREAEYLSDDYAGFGASYDDRAGEIIAGNTFDYPYVHGKALLDLGYEFCSTSARAFASEDFDLSGEDSSLISGYGASVLDIICGKQGGSERFPVFTDDLVGAIEGFTKRGGGVFLSGCNIASERPDFCAKVFGYKLATPRGTATGLVDDMPFASTLNPEVYCIEQPEGLLPVGKTAEIWLRYPKDSYGAAIKYSCPSHRAVSLGVPLETFHDGDDRLRILREALEYLIK